MFSLVTIYHFIDYHFQTDLEQVIAIVLTAFAQLNYTTTEIFDAAFEIAQFEKNLSQVYFLARYVHDFQSLHLYLPHWCLIT